MKQIFILLFILCVLPNFAFAASCYSRAEAEAEQGIRIHSELMVIGLNCQHMTPPGYKNFYAQYREFTSAHYDLIQAYENRLIGYYTRVGQGNPVKSLNNLRTGFANEISQNAADMRPDVFCSRYVDRMIKAAKMSKADIQKWAGTFYPSHPVSHPICEQ